MRTPNPPPHRWLVSEDSAGLIAIRAGTAATLAQAWTLALDTARAALLGGRAREFAIAVDDELPTLGYSPSRRPDGRLDVVYLLQDLDQLLRDVLRDLRPDVAAPTL
jgi:hypothetical protein